MTGFVTIGLVAIAAVALEIAVPGKAIYHTGWYNVALVAITVVTFAALRRTYRAASARRARIGLLAIGCGAGLAGLAGAANGLFAPDNQTVIGAPGQRMSVDALGTLVFPLGSGDSNSRAVRLERPLHASVDVGSYPRDVGSFIVRTVPRSVVSVEARDPRGGRLTVTQPNGSAFLSPVLLMDHRQAIAGMDLPFDSFNVPAARRVVKAVMFDPAQAAMLLRGGTRPGESAVLFAVDDENERPLRNGIALSGGGRPVRVGGLWLSGSVGNYPAVEVVSAPNLLATALAVLLAIGGLVAVATG